MLSRLKALRDRLLGKRHMLRQFSRQVAIANSTRLENGFGVDFLTAPEDRLYVSVGEQGMLNMNIVFESRQGTVRIGDRAYIGGGTIICRESVTVGDDVTMAWGVSIYDHNSNAFDWRQRAKTVKHFYENYGKPGCYEAIDWTGVGSGPIVIEDKVWIGFDAVILKDVRIGEGAIIGARAVVTRDVEPYTVVAGNPARMVRRIEKT
jgi:acetyltransferase-like isoleucine patch superfamily enzyme